MPTYAETLDPAQLLREFGRAPVLSLYLPVRPELSVPQGYRAELLGLLSATQRSVSEAAREAYDRASLRALDFVRKQYKPSGRTLALFVGPDAIRGEDLAIQLPAQARFQTGAFVSPLAAAVDDNPTVVIACVTQREYRAVASRLAHRFVTEHSTSDVPRRQRQGGWAASRYELDRERHVEEHVKDAAQRVADLCGEHAAKWLVLGGSNEITAMLRGALPAEARERVAGTFPVEMFASDDELLSAGLAVATRAEAAEEVALAQDIMSKALARANACLGWDETRTRLADGRVHVLALPRSALGSDAAEMALSLAWDTDARVEFIGPESEEVLQRYGGTGALLRY
jgi:peptide subunit release factor 1 (eRF1)